MYGIGTVFSVALLAFTVSVVASAAAMVAAYVLAIIGRR